MVNWIEVLQTTFDKIENGQEDSQPNKSIKNNFLKNTCTY